MASNILPTGKWKLPAYGAIGMGMGAAMGKVGYVHLGLGSASHAIGAFGELVFYLAALLEIFIIIGAMDLFFPDKEAGSALGADVRGFVQRRGTMTDYAWCVLLAALILGIGLH